MNSRILTRFFRFLHCDMTHDAHESREIVDEMLAVDMTTLDKNELGIILFAVSEFVRAHHRRAYIDPPAIEAMVSHLLETWQDDEVTELETLGAIYGGLRGINRFLKQDEVSKTIMTMKAYVYGHMIEKGTLCSDSSKTATRATMILACVPFGLFEPEDLVFVEAIKAINERRKQEGVTDHEALLLAWYFVEQGTYSITREILKTIDDNNEMNTTLYKLVFAKLQEKGGVDDYAIIHNPAGNNNIYEPGNDERFPKLVTVGDTVVIKAIACPLSPENQLVLLCNDTSYTGEIVDGIYWKFDMPPIAQSGPISYKLAFENKREIETPLHTFHVLEKLDLTCVESIYENLGSCSFKVGQLEISFDILEDDVLAIDVKPFELDQDKQDMSGKMVIKGLETTLEIDPKDLSFKYMKGQQLLVKSCKGDWLKVYSGPTGIEKINYNFISKDEKFYGFGERYNALNQRGNTPDNFVYNQYKEQGLKTYMPMPFYVSNKGYGILADTSNYSSFDMGEGSPNLVNIQVEASESMLKIIPGNINEVITKNAAHLGYPEMIPKWAFGPWMSSNNWDSEKEVRKQVAMTNELEIPATALVIEAWSDEATFYIFNDAKYQEKNGEDHLEYGDFTFPEWGRWPDPKGMVSHLHDNNLKCILWQIPVIKQISSLHHLQKDRDESCFIENGYGVKKADGQPYRLPEGWFKDSLLMDFSNTEGREWWFKKRQYLIDDLKIDGFKTDGGEFIFGKDLVFADGRTGKEMRNEYANDYIGAYYKLAKVNQGITFSRAGYKGANQYPAHWAGDERSTFDAFKRSIMAGLSSGISGLPFWGWDLGGFSGDVPTAELFIRSTQMAAFCPIMQYHAESKAEFNQDRTPWNIRDRSGDDRAVSVYRYYANVRMNLLPYIYQQALSCAETGLPLMKAMVLEYEEDLAVHELWDQYLFGNDLLVAPVINEGQVGRNVYFPKGEWRNLFTNELVSGPTEIKVEAGLEEMPVYVRGTCIVPMNLNEAFELGGKISNDLADYNCLSFRIYGTEDIDYTFTDDLNNRVHITVDRSEVTTIAVQSTYKEIYFILDESMSKIILNGQEVDAEMRQGMASIFKVNCY